MSLSRAQKARIARRIQKTPELLFDLSKAAERAAATMAEMARSLRRIGAEMQGPLETLRQGVRDAAWLAARARQSERDPRSPTIH